VTRPRAAIVENVVAFRRWPKYSLWRQAIESDGYKVDEIVIRASSLGVPQRRDRLFVVATRDGLNLEKLLADARTDEPGFGDCIDWEEGRWRKISSAPTANSRACYEAASRLGRAAVQLVSISTGAKAATGLGVEEPLRTITTKDQWRVVKGDSYRPFTEREYARGMGFPDSFGWPDGARRTDVIKGIGNAVCPKVATVLAGRVAAAI
jgi:DNA (cytosine-5)-methyltransferase 1